MHFFFYQIGAFSALSRPSPPPASPPRLGGRVAWCPLPNQEGLGFESPSGQLEVGNMLRACTLNRLEFIRESFYTKLRYNARQLSFSGIYC